MISPIFKIKSKHLYTLLILDASHINFSFVASTFSQVFHTYATTTVHFIFTPISSALGNTSPEYESQQSIHHLSSSILNWAMASFIIKIIIVIIIIIISKYLIWLAHHSINVLGVNKRKKWLINIVCWMLNILVVNLILSWLTLNCTLIISTVHIVFDVLSILCAKLLFQSY